MSIYNDFMALTPEIRATLLQDLGSYADYTLEQEYETMLDECFEDVKIAGYSYRTSMALQAVDPVAYRCGFADWISDNDSYTEVEGKTYRTEDLEEALEAYNDSIEDEE